VALFRSWQSLLVLSLIIIGVDFISKAWVTTLVQRTPAPLPYLVFSDFFGVKMQITHAINTGAAWGVLADFPQALVLIRVMLIAALIIYLLGVNHREQWNVPLALIISGAIGNVIDYFYYGYVVDMFQFRFWGYEYPIFNIADSAIFIGSFWILFAASTEKTTS
jgi:signal peptidase II